ncbi:MAG TPA: DUF2304 family protein [Bacteroidetes bacterium]|nr:DUF2304 family protein [Bacteroidota bacterium]
MATLLQIVVVAFAVFAISRAVLRFNDRRMGLTALVMWSVLWIGAMVVVLLPQTSFFFANILGIPRGADFVVYISIIALFYLMFRLYVKIDSVEKNVTLLVRETAIKKSKKK